jgi:hypothetical protein
VHGKSAAVELGNRPVGTFQVDRDRKYQQGRVVSSADVRAALN